MKTLFTLIISAFTLASFSQKGHQSDLTEAQWKAAGSLQSASIQINESGLDSKTMIRQTAGYPENIVIKKVREVQSKAFTHTSYDLYKDGVRIYGVSIKLSKPQNGGSYKLQYPALNFSSTEANFPSSQLAVSHTDKIEEASILKNEAVWIVSPQGFLTAGRLVEASSESTPELHRELLLVGNQVVRSHDLNRYYDHQHSGPNDTTVNVFVFDPDPLSSAGKTYGGPFVDNNDGDSPELNNQRKLRQTTFSYIDGEFVAENDYLKIVDFSKPSVSPVRGTRNLFDFTRSQDEFEDVNVMFHITQQREFLDRLGYPQLPSYQIEVDAHAVNGADQSFFSTSDFPHRLYFGEGGVDDAEDADVILHEFSHAVIYEAAPSQNINTERACLEEAICDYYAISYSKTRHTFNADKVFNWDGHNSFWNGRNGKTGLTYDNVVFTSDIYAYTSVLVSPLLSIYDQLGRETTDELVTEAIYFLQGQSSMPDFARYMLQADSALNGAANANVIAQAFADQKILDQSVVSQNEFEIAEQTELELLGSSDFNHGGELTLNSKSERIESLQLFDLQGRLMLQLNPNSYSAKVSAAQLSSGHYILHATVAGNAYSYKLSVH